MSKLKTWKKLPSRSLPPFENSTHHSMFLLCFIIPKTHRSSKAQHFIRHDSYPIQKGRRQRRKKNLCRKKKYIKYQNIKSKSKGGKGGRGGEGLQLLTPLVSIVWSFDQSFRFCRFSLLFLVFCLTCHLTWTVVRINRTWKNACRYVLSFH